MQQLIGLTSIKHGPARRWCCTVHQGSSCSKGQEAASEFSLLGSRDCTHCPWASSYVRHTPRKTVVGGQPVVVLAERILPAQVAIDAGFSRAVVFRPVRHNIEDVLFCSVPSVTMAFPS